LVELLKQPLNSPMPVEEQVVSIFAGTKGYLDDVPVGEVRRFEAELLDFMRTRHGSMLDEIRTSGVPDGLADVVEGFKSQFLAAEAERRAADPTATTAGEVGEAQSNKTLATE
jgi:F-type H+-transporting ATPase subunit alpha